jgi:hypothetical protein
MGQIDSSISPLVTEISQIHNLAADGRRRARFVLLTFLLMFITARIVTFMIMSRRIPDLYVHLGGTHIHHLNLGIFILSAVGAYLLFAHPSGHGKMVASIGYGIGLSLTFDEFGMWLHLGGDYWQHASFDAISVLAALLVLIAFAPPLRSWRSHHFAMALFIAGIVVVFYLMLAESFHFAVRVEPRLEQLDRHGPN